MTITGLNHVNLRAPAELMERLRTFYCDVIGLELGPRPGFRSVGYWLYAGSQPVVHLSRTRDGDRPARVLDGAHGATLDHFAFSATDPAGTAARLRARGVDFVVERHAVTRQHQFFLTDPAGNGLELNFPYDDEHGTAHD